MKTERRSGKDQRYNYNLNRRYISMSRSKLYFFLVILMLITVGTFMAGLEAQNTEKKRAPVQEFVKMAQEFVELNQQDLRIFEYY